MSSFTDLHQFKRGKDMEAFLDQYYRGRGYHIRQTTSHEERVLCLGDRQFSRAGKSFFVEYKSGIQTHYTGNIFLETISVDDPQNYREGWVYTCRADFIIYATVLDHCLLIFSPAWLRQRMPILKRMFPQIATSHDQNRGYNTHGLIIPFDFARDNLAKKVVDLSTIDQTKEA